MLVIWQLGIFYFTIFYIVIFIIFLILTFIAPVALIFNKYIKLTFIIETFIRFLV